MNMVSWKKVFGLINRRSLVINSMYLIPAWPQLALEITRKSSTYEKIFRLYVGNLDDQVTWKELKDHMKIGGRIVRANVKTDTSGKPLGWGLVEYSSLEDAEQAIAKLNNSELMGKTIRVRADKNQSERREITELEQPIADKSFVSRGSLYAAKLGVSRTVYVGNLPYQVSWQDLKDHMKQAGNVVRANVIMDGDGRSKGCGLVDYETVEEANHAISTLHDTNLKGRLIFVREDRDKDVNNPNSKANYQRE